VPDAARPDPEHGPAAADVVERGQLPGERHRMPEFGEATQVPRRTPEVTLAAATSVGMVAPQGVPANGSHVRWS
jgi:hypothetical protein